MERWNWFVAADYQGKWINTNGFAAVSIANGTLSALLHYKDGVIYHQVEGKINADNSVDAKVSSPDRKIEPFDVRGQLFTGSETGNVQTKMLLLTDGTTVIGLAYGPRSNESNL